MRRGAALRRGHPPPSPPLRIPPPPVSWATRIMSRMALLPSLLAWVPTRLRGGVNVMRGRRLAAASSAPHRAGACPGILRRTCAPAHVLALFFCVHVLSKVDKRKV